MRTRCTMKQNSPFSFSWLYTPTVNQKSTFFSLSHTILIVHESQTVNEEKNEPSKIRRSSQNMRCLKNSCFLLFRKFQSKHDNSYQLKFMKRTTKLKVKKQRPTWMEWNKKREQHKLFLLRACSFGRISRHGNNLKHILLTAQGGKQNQR